MKYPRKLFCVRWSFQSGKQPHWHQIGATRI